MLMNVKNTFNLQSYKFHSDGVVTPNGNKYFLGLKKVDETVMTPMPNGKIDYTLKYHTLIKKPE